MSKEKEVVHEKISAEGGRSMMGAIVGDVVGSRFEWHNRKTKDFELFMTGDTSARKVSKGYAEAKAAYEAANKAESRRRFWLFGKRGKRLGSILAESGSLLSSSIKVDAAAPKHPFCRSDRACHYTDDTVMTLAVAAAIIDWRGGAGDLGACAVRRMQEFGRRFPPRRSGACRRLAANFLMPGTAVRSGGG